MKSTILITSDISILITSDISIPSPFASTKTIDFKKGSRYVLDDDGDFRLVILGKARYFSAAVFKKLYGCEISKEKTREDCAKAAHKEWIDKNHKDMSSAELLLDKYEITKRILLENDHTL